MRKINKKYFPIILINVLGFLFILILGCIGVGQSAYSYFQIKGIQENPSILISGTVYKRSDFNNSFTNTVIIEENQSGRKLKLNLFKILDSKLSVGDKVKIVYDNQNNFIILEAVELQLITNVLNGLLFLFFIFISLLFLRNVKNYLKIAGK